VIAALLDHIWQSTLFAGGIAGLTLLFRRNSAALRFWLWFAASVKFLVPFAALALLGEYLSRLFPATLPSSILAIQPTAEKLSVPARMLAAAHSQDMAPNMVQDMVQGMDVAHGMGLAPLLLGIWLAGVAAIFCLQLLRWVRLRRLTDTAQDLAEHLPRNLSVPAPVRIKSSPSLMEPGLVGIFSPVVMLPAGLMALLSGPERDSILAHELTHLRRRDNVTATVHMAVEALFWFYPPVWLIGGRLIDERERACDESVLASGHDPEVYAGGILKVCKFCIPSPMASAAGVSGSDLKNRVRQIMSGEALLSLTPAKRLLLAGAAAVVLLLPVMAGFVNTPLIVQVKRNVVAVQARAQQAVTAMAQQIGVPADMAVTRLPRLKMVKVTALPRPAAFQAVPVPAPVPALPAEPVAAEAPSVPAADTQPAAAPPAAKEAIAALNPVGTGDPDSLTCRVPQQLPGSRLPGPQVCKTNRQWAQLRAAHQDIGPDGRTIVQLDGAKRDAAVCNNIRTLDWATSNSGRLPGNFCF
jgi:beta-lactamase regulating signal transducer with metallopeptidase domain